jgi:hypothetical protein
MLGKFPSVNPYNLLRSKERKKMKKILLITCFLSTVILMPGASEAITVVIANDPNGTFEGTPRGTNPSTGHETSEFNLAAAYQNLFGAPSPNVLPRRSLWGETPTQMSLGFNATGENVNVAAFQEFDFDIFGDYWTLDSKLTFNPSTAVIVDPNDHILWDGTLQHTGKLSTNDFPHEGDDKEGPPLKFSIDLSAGDKTDALFGRLTHAFDFKFAGHPSIGHADALLGLTQARVVSPSIFFDEIEGSYTGLMVAFHLDGQGPVVPEQATLGLWGSGFLGLMAMTRKNRKQVKGFKPQIE